MYHKKKIYLLGLCLSAVMTLVAILVASAANGNGSRHSVPSFLDMPSSMPEFQLDNLTDNPVTYNIAYAVDANSVVDSAWFSVDGLLSSALQAHVVTNMAGLFTFADDVNIDVLIIHASAYNWIDHSWVNQLEQRGVAIAAINVSIGQFAELTDDNCIRQNGDAYMSVFETLAENYYYVSFTQIFAENAEDEAIIRNAFETDCSRGQPPFNVGASQIAYLSGFKSDGQLDSETDFVKFTNDILDAAFKGRALDIQWEERYLPYKERTDIRQGFGE